MACYLALSSIVSRSYFSPPISYLRYEKPPTAPFPARWGRMAMLAFLRGEGVVKWGGGGGSGVVELGWVDFAI